jgi:glycosyltransferase involved in cell wall biosynthesis
MSVGKNYPKVSVILATKNGDKNLKSAIESILFQDYENLELIIIDDCSSDTTPDILIEFAKNPKVRTLRNKKNLGLAKSLNQGLRVSTGSLIARMDDDDYSVANRISLQVEFLEKNPNVDVLGTGAILVDGIGNEIREFFPPEYDAEIKKMLIYRNPLFHPTIMFRKTFIDAFGGYDEDLRRKEDLDLWGRAASTTTFHNLQRILLKYTVKNKKTLSALPAGVVVRIKNGFRLGAPFKALVWCILYVIIEIARHLGYRQRFLRK